MSSYTLRTIRRCACLAFCLFLLGLLTDAKALEPGTALRQYAHKVWQVGDAGLFGIPQAITQTQDGYIWVSTSNGLFRFDGVQFRRWVPPPGETLSSDSFWHLLGARNGALYVGSDHGLVRISDGHVYQYPDSPRWPGPFIEDAHGAIWMGVSGAHSPPSALCAVGDTKLNCMDSKQGFQCGRGLSNTIGQDGSIWIGGSDGTCRWKSGLPPEHDIVPALDHRNGLHSIKSLATGADGTLWAGTQHAGSGEGLLRFTGGSWRTYRSGGLDGEAIAVSSLLSMADNSLWIGTTNNGFYRLANGTLDHFGAQNGLSGQRVLSFFKDREGGLWVVTPGGVDYFRDYTARSFTPDEHISENRARAVAARGNDVFLGGDSLVQLHAGQVHRIHDERGEALQDIQFLFVDSLNDLWVGAGNRLLVLKADNTVVEVTGFSALKSEIVEYITEDGDHNIWVSSENLKSRRSSLFRLHGGEIVDTYSSAPISNQVMNALAPNPAGGLWVGGALHGLFWFHDGQFERVLSDSFDDRVENLLQEADGALWIVTPRGFIRYADGKGKLLSSANGLPCDGAVNIQDDGQGALWLYLHCGIFRISEQSIGAWWSRPEMAIRGTAWGALDGAEPSLFSGSPAQTSEGELWSANGYGFQIIDRKHLPFNPTPPNVAIEMLSADGKALALEHALRLPANTHEVQIDYAGLSFLIPERVRFRYRLETHDANWIDAGTRRQAFYNDLRPGRYIFHVVASNNDGVWNQQGAMIAFNLLPAWYQTALFRFIAVLMGLGVLISVYFLRLSHYTSLLKMKYEERLDERTRLARDLHDTLLQTIQGSKIVADEARDHIDNPQITGRALDKLSEWLERAIYEGRDALEVLRNSSSESDSLAAALRRAVDDCIFDSNLKFSVAIHGVDRELHPIARDEIYRIGYEAIRNACAHAGGTVLDIEIYYRRASFQLDVRDNGRGMAPAFQVSGKSGHFGLTGMRERALSLGGTLDITSGAAGTVVILRIPGNVVYLNRPWLPFRWLQRVIRDFLE